MCLVLVLYIAFTILNDGKNINKEKRIMNTSDINQNTRFFVSFNLLPILYVQFLVEKNIWKKLLVFIKRTIFSKI